MPDGNPKVVVVEDDASMGQAIERILRTGNCEPVMFGSAEEALASDAAALADCFVVDIRLPGMSGFEFYHQLTLYGEEAPVIFITGHDEPEVRKKAGDMGAICYLPKPFSGRTLLDAIAQALRP